MVTFISIIIILNVLLQNGYPSRRRSLVDDARFESAVVKQTKQTVLEEARLKANGKCHVILSVSVACIKRNEKEIKFHFLFLDFVLIFVREKEGWHWHRHNS